MTGLPFAVTETWFRRLLALLAVVAVANALLMARLNPDRIVEGTDSPQYDLIAKNLLEGHGFSFSSAPPYAATVYREPMYPAFVAALYAASGRSLDMVMMAQAALVGLTAVATALLGTHLFGRAEGVLAGFILALSTEMAHYAHWLLSEALFTWLFVLLLGLALVAQASGRRLDHAAVGALLGLAILTRVIAASVAVPLVLGLALLPGTAVRRVPNAAATRAVLVMGAAALVLAPWLLRNTEVIGRPVLTSRGGVNLLRRAPRVAEPPEVIARWAVASVWIATNPLSHVVYPLARFQWGERPEENLIWDFHVNEGVRYLERYDPVCRAQPDWEACATEIGLAFATKYPVQFVAQSLFEVVKLHFQPLPGIQALVHNATVWLGAAGVVAAGRRRQLGRPHALVLLATGGYVGASVVVDTQVRYLLPVLPVYICFAAALLLHLVRGARTWRDGLAARRQALRVVR